MATDDIKIDRRFRDLIPPLNDDELHGLRESITTQGCRDPLVVWTGHNILLDGHNRRDICNEAGLPFDMVEIDLPDREAAIRWILKNQMGRRNVDPDTAAWMRGAYYESLKRSHGGDRKSEVAKSKGKNCPLISGETADNVAEVFKVSARTIKNDAAYFRALPVAEKLNKKTKSLLHSNTTSRAAVILAAKIADDGHKAEARKLLTGDAKPSDVTREIKREEARAKLESIEAVEAKASEGVYDVIVIDPPWPMQKIERDVRPNQSEMDYPTMTEDELADLDIPCTGDCHVWVWTTHKFLPMALRLLDAWGLRYVCTFVWHKPGGFQPIGLPQYNCEFALYAREGTPEFLDTKAFNVCFEAARGKHSEKPEEFYDVVRRVTAGRRLDMFNRRPIEGFDQWGNEA